MCISVSMNISVYECMWEFMFVVLDIFDFVYIFIILCVCICQCTFEFVCVLYSEYIYSTNMFVGMCMKKCTIKLYFVCKYLVCVGVYSFIYICLKLCIIVYVCKIVCVWKVIVIIKNVSSSTSHKKTPSFRLYENLRKFCLTLSFMNRFW